MNQNNNISQSSPSATHIEEVDMMTVLSGDVVEEVEKVLGENEVGFKLEDGLPDYVSIGDDGFYIHLELLSGPHELKPFIDNLFAGGYYIDHIVYSDFLSLYFDSHYYETHKGEPVRIGKGIRILEEKRVLKLYKNLLASKNEISFLFDKFLFLEDEDNLGNYSFDEILAVLWAQGVKNGLLESEIKSAIDGNETKKIIIARDTPAIAGEDAKIVQVYSYVEKDFSPVEVNGITDYTTAYNNVPQVNENIHIFKKVPIKYGKDGRDLYGNPIPQPILKDIDLHKKRGEGTKIISLDFGEEALISDVKGFLDVKLGKVSVTKNRKPHRGNIDARTLNITIEPGKGDFTLIGDITTEYKLEGNDLSITGDIYGKAISKGGIIKVKGTITGGKDRKGNPTGYIYNADGDIEFLGGVINEGTVIAPFGKVDLTKVTAIAGGKISGQEVLGGYARNTTIIANTVTLKKAENCTIIAKNIHIDELISGRSGENNVYIVVQADIETLKKELQELEQNIINLGNDTLQKKKKFFELQQSFASRKFSYNNPVQFRKEVNAILQPLRPELLKKPEHIQALPPEERKVVVGRIMLGRQLEQFAILFDEIPSQITQVKEWKEQKEKVEKDILDVTNDPPSCHLGQIGGDTNIFRVIGRLEDSHYQLSKERLISILGDIMCITRIDSNSEEFGKGYDFSL